MSNKTEGRTRPSPAAVKRNQIRRRRRIARLLGLAAAILLAFAILAVDLFISHVTYTEGLNMKAAFTAFNVYRPQKHKDACTHLPPQ